VLALRDGLYATCQAYTNGALGQSAYALGLSQYGNLLVALTAHDAGAPGGTSAGAVGPTVPIPTPPGASNTNNNTAQKTTARFASAGDLPLLLVSTPPTAAAQAQQSANPADPAIFTPTDSAAVALMVACISEYDPTRLAARNPATGQFVTSDVLSESFCNDYIRRFSQKLMVVTAARPK
jgi:hypothetical protein